jgi:hypothetical protein
MICEWLMKRIAPNPSSNYLVPKSFSTDANAEQEIKDAIAELNKAAKEFSSSASFSEQYLDLIHEAEAQAAQGHWAEAEQKVWEATFLVNRAIESSGLVRLRCWIGFWLIIWLIALAAVGIFLKDYEAGRPEFFGIAYWRYLYMGALGGITIAAWGIVKHTKELNFDSDFTLWYFLRPALGAITGLVSVLIVKAGFFALQGGTLQERSPYLLYVLAFLAGFSERFFIRIADSVMTTLLGGPTSPSAKAKAPSVPIPPTAKTSPGGSVPPSSPATPDGSKPPGTP